MRTKVVVLAVVELLGLTASALADEGIFPLAESGDWVAVAHHASMTAPPDVCIAGNDAHGIVFRADRYGFQLRIFDQKWSLPANVHGNIFFSTQTLRLALDISDNTVDWVEANLSKDTILDMFAAMDIASSMTIAVGKAKPFVISLIGSTAATNAFRTCAGLKGNVPSPGSNPFQ